MSIGTVVLKSRGLAHPDRLYIKLRGNAVYVYPRPLSTWNITRLTDAIDRNNGRVKLKYWKKVR
jgi:hypothetical protein